MKTAMHPVAAVCLAVALVACGAFAAEDKHPFAEVVAPKWQDDRRARNAEMKRRVDAWLADATADAAPIYVVYLSCSDQNPFPDHRKRIDHVLSEIQYWFGVQTEAAGFGRVTFNLQRDANKRLVLHEGKLPFAVASRTKNNKHDTSKHCRNAARAVLAAQNIDYDKSFVFVLTTIPDDHGAAPFYGNIIQDRGYCFAVDAPWIDTNYTKKGGPKVWKGKPVGPANSALIGGMAHELGHGFGLPHSDEPAAERDWGESLMGSGNYTWRGALRGERRDSYLLDTDAMLLISRPIFNRKTRGFDKQPKASVKEVRFVELDDGRVKVTGRIEADIPAYAVKIFDDPPGNGSYNAVAHASLPDEKTGAFEIVFKAHTAKGVHDLRLVAMHVNGRWTQVVTAMHAGDNGKIDLSKANRDLGKK